MKQIVNLSCTCCGAAMRGRQWWNQDDGFGLCDKCVDWIQRRGTYSPEEFERTYGKSGVHYKLSESIAA